jgi:hypothetical protein
MLLVIFKYSVPDRTSPWWGTWERAGQGDLASASETDLRYKYFGASVTLSIGGVEVISPKRLVALVDLAFSIRVSAERIASGHDGAFGFTESEEVVRFRREGDLVHVSSSVRSVHAEASADEIVAQFVQFVWSVYWLLIERYPRLRENANFVRLADGLHSFEG